MARGGVDVRRWGAYQGLLLVIFRLVALVRRRRGRRRALAGWTFGWREIPGALGMFALTCYGWLLFRSDSWTHAATLTGRLLAGGDLSWAVLSNVGVPVAVYAGPMLALHAAEAARGDLDAIPHAPIVARYAVYAALIYTIVLFSDFRGSEFLYFQF